MPGNVMSTGDSHPFGAIGKWNGCFIAFREDGLLETASGMPDEIVEH